MPHHQRFSGEIFLNRYTMLWFYAFGKEKVLATLYTCSKCFVYATILTEIISLKTLLVHYCRNTEKGKCRRIYLTKVVFICYAALCNFQIYKDLNVVLFV